MESLFEAQPHKSDPQQKAVNSVKGKGSIGKL